MIISYETFINNLVEYCFIHINKTRRRRTLFYSYQQNHCTQ